MYSSIIIALSMHEGRLLVEYANYPEFLRKTILMHVLCIYISLKQ